VESSLAYAIISHELAAVDPPFRTGLALAISRRRRAVEPFLIAFCQRPVMICTGCNQLGESGRAYRNGEMV
jgi:hypothetical protein